MFLIALSLLATAAPAIEPNAPPRCSVVRQSLMEAEVSGFEAYRANNLALSNQRAFRLAQGDRTILASDVRDLAQHYDAAKLADGRVAMFEIETTDNSRNLAVYKDASCLGTPLTFDNFAENPPKFVPHFAGFRIVDGEKWMSPTTYVVAYFSRDSGRSVLMRVGLADSDDHLPQSVTPMLEVKGQILAISASRINLHGSFDVSVLTMVQDGPGQKVILTGYTFRP